MSSLSFQRVIGPFFWLWFLGQMACFPSGNSKIIRPTSRLVAIGDIHGNFEGLTSILQKAQLIDTSQHWIGKDAILVQTGDMLDRGPGVKKVMDLLMKLQQQALLVGGQVVVLLGNHELMNLVGDYRYVSKQAYVDFVSDDSQTILEESFLAEQKILRKIDPEKPEVPLSQWMLEHPKGILEYRRALGPLGLYGKWLRKLPVWVQVGEVLFLHGGIAPYVAELGLSHFQVQWREELDQLDGLRTDLVKMGLILETHDIGWLYQQAFQGLANKLTSGVQGRNPKETKRWHGMLQLLSKPVSEWVGFREDNPLWFRGNESWEEERLLRFLPQFLEKNKAQTLVVAHSPCSEGRIRSRLDHRLFLIDTGMQDRVYVGGRPAALEFRGGRVFGIYLDRRDLLVDFTSLANQTPSKCPTHSLVFLDVEGKALPFEDHDEVLDFLKTAALVSHKTIHGTSSNPKKCILSKNGLRVHAIFRTVHEIVDVRKPDEVLRGPRFHRDSYLGDVAAYFLNRELGLCNLPPVVVREIEGKQGSLQLWIEKAMTETKRLQNNIDPPDVGHWNRQFRDMQVFDNLIRNMDRNQGNILIGPDFQLWLIDHTRTFAAEKDLPRPEKISGCSKNLYQAIKGMSKKRWHAWLDPLLDEREISALWARRQKLLEKLDCLMHDTEVRTLLRVH